jgi:pentatricopeptide repeat protein
MMLMDVYAKTNQFKVVLQVLGEMPSRSVVSWTMLAASLVRGGQRHYTLFPPV